MPFYVFNQNNSGGNFIVEQDHSAHEVVVEADSEGQAWDIATSSTGVYRNFGVDCECCGDRWNDPYGPYQEPRLSYGNYTIMEWQFNIEAQGCLGNETALIVTKDGRRIWVEQTFSKSKFEGL